MRTVSTLFAMCALALSIPAAGQYVANCNNGCTVVITVPAVCGAAFKVVPDPVIVDNGKAPVITWEVAGDAWIFDPVKGIDITKRLNAPVLMLVFFVVPVLFALLEPDKSYRVVVLDQTGKLGDGVDPYRVLEAARARIPVTRFELAEPSIHDIFIERVSEPS